MFHRFFLFLFAGETAMEWFAWIPNDELRAVFDYTLTGGKLEQEAAVDAINQLHDVSKQLITDRVKQDFYNKYFPTDRHGPAWKAGRPFGLVDHYTAGTTAAGTLRWFSRQTRPEGSGNSSAHFVMDRDGTAMILVDPLTTVSWHARQQSYTHIGIEHVNAGLLRKSGSGYLFMDKFKYPKDREEWVQEMNSGFWEPYSSAQIVSNIALKRLLLQAIPSLEKAHFVDHQQIDPTRKLDCGPMWPLHRINDLVFSWKPVRGLKSLEPKYLMKNAVAVFNSEVERLL
jgi:N-acetyl-anhydromuramyl-L-alanine amidase AmpD